MNVESILSGLTRLSALVVGDMCLDRWCTYDQRLAAPSRETGIPRIGVVATEVTPGGGGTIASNLSALGVGRVAVLGVVGDDGFGYELRESLKARGIDPDLLIGASSIPTFTYHKLINKETGEEDLPRVDFVQSTSLPANIEAVLVERLNKVASQFDVILVSDQAEIEEGGAVTSRLRDALSAIATSNPDTVVWADSRVRLELFRNVILKPNHVEAEAACSRLGIARDYTVLRKHTGAPLLIVTHSGAGATIVDSDGERVVATRNLAKPVDICGAGDSFSAAAATAFKLTRSAEDAARFGNLIASITIMKKGTGTASPDEVRTAARDLP